MPRIPAGGRARVQRAPGILHSGGAAWKRPQAATPEETASCPGLEVVVSLLIRRKISQRGRPDGRAREGQLPSHGVPKRQGVQPPRAAGARRGREGKPGATLPAPQGSAEGEQVHPRSPARTPQASWVAALTVVGGRRAWLGGEGSAARRASRWVRTGGWGVESGSHQGFYGAPSPRQEGPRAITLG